MKSFLKKIKHKIVENLLERAIDSIKRNRTIININNAKSIGVLYNATEEDRHNTVNDFVKLLLTNKKQVKALGYVNLKQFSLFHVPKLQFDFFINKDVNWHYKPKGHIVKNFIEEPFDILICLDDKEFVLKYISIYSVAKYKVGKFDKKNEKIYDLMINNSGSDLSNLIAQIFHYLSTIKIA